MGRICAQQQAQQQAQRQHSGSTAAAQQQAQQQAQRQAQQQHNGSTAAGTAGTAGLTKAHADGSGGRGGLPLTPTRPCPRTHSWLTAHLATTSTFGSVALMPTTCSRVGGGGTWVRV